MFLRIIFLLLLVYIIYNFFKLVFQIGMRGMKEMRGNNPRGSQNAGEGAVRNRKNNQDKVIELDKDQYKIE